MATILLRTANSISSPGSTVKGTPLTNSEVDNNFSNINITLGVLSNLSTTANANLVAAINSVTYAVGSSGNVLTSNGSTWSSKALPASGLSYVTKSTTYTTQNNEGVLANTALGSFTVTLPSSPVVGNQVVIADENSTWGANNLIIGRNGATISNSATDLICDISGVSIQLVYTGNTWDIYSQIGGNSGTAVTLDGIQTLTNKTLTTPTLNSPTLITPALGTPSSVVLTNATGTASNLTSGKITIVDENSSSSTFYPMFTSSNAGGLAANVSSARLTFTPSTGLLTSTDYNSSSDMTLKQDITPIQNPLDIISQLTGFGFTWKESKQKSFGLSAQEVEKVLPEIVRDRADGTKGINYMNLTAFLIEAIKDLKQEIQELKKPK